MKRIFSVILAAVMLFCFAACQPVSKDSIQPAIYKMEDELYPRLYLRENNDFSLLITAASSANTRGTYSVEDGVLRLEGEEGQVYCFDIKRDSLIFNGELSDEFESSKENMIADGTKFELWHQANTVQATEQ